MAYTPSPQIIDFMILKLGEAGISHFERYYNEYGTVNPCIPADIEGGMPHLVHFCEGMSVRNMLRGSKLTKGWSSHDYDNRWAIIVLEALRQHRAGQNEIVLSKLAMNTCRVIVIILSICVIIFLTWFASQ